MHEFLTAYGAHALEVVTYPLHPESRIYVLYLATSVLAAWLVWRAARRRGAGERTFLRFLFPARVWRHPSAWLHFDRRQDFFRENESLAVRRGE